MTPTDLLTVVVLGLTLVWLTDLALSLASDNSPVEVPDMLAKIGSER